MAYNDDKRELLKLKQGLITEEESVIASAEKPVIEKPTGKAAVANFFYHYKVHLIVAAFFIVVGGYLAYDTITREKEDIRFLSIATSDDGTFILSAAMTGIEEAMEFYTPDFDSNGYVHAANFFINANQNGVSPDFFYGNRGKLIAEVQDGTARIFVGDKGAFELFEEDIPYEQFFFDLKARYPNNPQITDRFFYRIDGSTFAGKAGITGDVLYIAVRLPNGGNKKVAENTEKALTVMDAICAG